MGAAGGPLVPSIVVVALLFVSSFGAFSFSASRAAPGPPAASLPGGNATPAAAASSPGRAPTPESPPTNQDTGLAFSVACGSGGNATPGPAGGPLVAAELGVATAAGVCPQYLFPPHAPAAPTQLAAANATGAVSPLYQAVPAPIGLAELGVRTGPAGSRTAFWLNTTSVRGSVDANATGIQPRDLVQAEPDGYSVQLNAVMTNVRLFGHTDREEVPFEFWTQNVVQYEPLARTMTLVSNVWNFSGAAISANAVYAHGPHGRLVPGSLYYANYTIPGPVTYPFDLTLFVNSSVVDRRDAVTFTAQLAGPGERWVEPFDYVIFNSVGRTGTGARAPANFTAEGHAYDPERLANDFELTIGGPGDGSQADLFAADADLALAYWNATARDGAGGYESVPSAISYGSDTGETATGGTVDWSNASGGPAGVSPYGQLRTGPTILRGLWNDSGAEGAVPVTLAADPTNAFEIVTPQFSAPWSNLSRLTVDPPARGEAAEAYSPALGAVVLFGGFDGGPLGDTWLFSHGNWTEWTGALAPPPAWGGSLVYDAADGYLLLFGGRNATSFFDESWAFNATGWHRIATGAAPSPRAFEGLAWDAADGRVVLFGGGTERVADGPYALFNDTWTYAGGAWTNVTAGAGAAPPARLVGGGMAYDGADGYVLLVGGARDQVSLVRCSLVYTTEWAFDGGRWNALSVVDAPPPGYGSLWFDAANDTTYYYEGMANESATACGAADGAVYAYASGAWTEVQIPPPNGPVARVYAPIVDDAADGVQLVYGGLSASVFSPLGDTWSFAPAGAEAPYPTLAWRDPTYAPTLYTRTYWLPPGNYTLDTLLSGYDPTSTELTVVGPLTVATSLVRDPGAGLYTPLWAWSSGQLPAISSGGSGTERAPYRLVSNEGGSVLLDPVFDVFNDYGFPVYPGIFLYNTRAYVAMVDTTALDTLSPADGEPAVTLPYWFWNVTDLAFVNDTAGFAVPYPAGADSVFAFDPADLVFFESSHNLVAGNDLTVIGAERVPDATTGVSVIAYSGGNATGPENDGGGNNTFWGNTFSEEYESLGLLPSLILAEPNDLVYNNRFDPYTVAWQFAVNTYSERPDRFAIAWNITPQPAAVVHVADGFPWYPMSGSIAGTARQGGNEWWNYGLWPDAYGAPFTEAIVAVEYPTDPPIVQPALLYPNADDAPLYAGTLYPVALSEVGLPPVRSWSGYLEASSAGLLFRFNTTAPTVTAFAPNGTYTLLLASQPGFRLAESVIPLTVDGGGAGATADFAPLYRITLSEIGLPLPYVTWTAQPYELAAPPPLDDPMEAYDPALGAIVLFGGYSPLGPPLNGTWIYNASGWSALVTPVAPPARYGGMMVYDAADARLVLFGGRNATGSPLNDTWTFSAAGWTEVVGGPAPSARAFAGMVYDPSAGAVVLYGGGVPEDGTGSVLWHPLSDTWTFRAGRWTNISASAGAPPARLAYQIAYDGATGQVLLVGGQVLGFADPSDCGFTYDDAWAFANGSWAELQPSGEVPPAGTGELWYDPTVRTVFYDQAIANESSGAGPDCAVSSGAVYAYADARWTLVGTEGPQTPPPLVAAEVVYDPALNDSVLAGGAEWFGGSLFEFPTTTWSFAYDPHGEGTQPIPWGASLGAAAATGEGPTIALSVLAGTYRLAAVAVPGYGLLSPVLGSAVSVRADLNLTLTFAPTPTYPVRFEEVGLPGGSEWCVVAGNRTCGYGSELYVGAFPSGRIPYVVLPAGSYIARVLTGNLSVHRGPVTHRVRFTAGPYPVTFRETGLRPGTRWSVAIDGQRLRTDRPSLVVRLPAGSYAYSFPSVAGYASSGPGTLTVSSGSLEENVSYALGTYRVTFEETGAPPGTNWSLTIRSVHGWWNGSAVVHRRTVWSDGASTISVELPNGSYERSLGRLAGYHGTVRPRGLRVAGADLVVTVTFRPVGRGAAALLAATPAATPGRPMRRSSVRPIG